MKSRVIQLVMLLAGLMFVLPPVFGDDSDFEIETRADGERVLTNYRRKNTLMYTRAPKVPSGVTIIGANAFAYSGFYNDNTALPSTMGIRQVTIPASVKEIGVNAFQHCSNLNTVIIEGGNHLQIQTRAFAYCGDLERVYMKDGVETIGNSVFLGCEELDSVAFPSSVRTLGDYVFEDCEELRTLIFNEGLEHIGRRLFDGCEELTTVRVPNTVTSFGGISNVRDVDGFIIQKYESPFLADEDAGLTTLIFSEGRKEIPARTCWNAGRLRSVSLPSTLEAIGEQAFEKCGTLECNMKFPASLRRIGDGAFRGCTWTFTSNDSRVLMLNEGLASIGSEAFYNCYGIRTVYIPSTVSYIGPRAFGNPLSYLESIVPDMYLSSIIIASDTPSVLKTIPPGAFQDCRRLTSITNPLPYGITAIEKDAFRGCYWLQQKIDLPMSVTRIGDGAFHTCGVTQLVIHENIKSIGKEAFYGADLSEGLYVRHFDPLPAGERLAAPAGRHHLHIPQAAYYRYRNSPNWNSSFPLIIYDDDTVDYIIPDIPSPLDPVHYTVYDTTHVPIVVLDTTRVDTVPLTVYDTTRRDTIVYDITHIEAFTYDTVYVPVTITLPDTAYDTLWYNINSTVVIIDTTLEPITIYDTIEVIREVHDTLYLNAGSHDTIYLYDTTTLVVVIDPSTEAETPVDDALRAYAWGGVDMYWITGLDPTEDFDIYDATGALVYRGRTLPVQLSGNGIFIVRQSGRYYRLVK